MAKAKTASKNNPTTREKAKEVIYNGKKVKPIKYVFLGGNYMSASYEDGSVVLDSAGNPLAWAGVVTTANAQANASS